MRNHKASWLIRTRNALCALYLMLFVVFETYSAGATALDRSNRFPAWEAKLGWCLFILPCLLATGLVFLLRGERKTLGFSLAGLSILLYLTFMFVEDALSPEHMNREDWVFNSIWIVLCAIATAGESRFRTAFLLAFAFLALFVASIGLYGVLSYSVTQRTREFGIRMAVGATRGAVLRVVLARAARFVCIGVCVGIVGALALTHLIASLLFGITPFDISIFVSVPVLLIAIAFLASYFPARRASSINPMDALRYE